MSCPLCGGDESSSWYEDKRRRYLRCGGCSLIFVPQEELIPWDEERRHYDTHENSEADPRYRRYLEGITSGVLPHLPAGAMGLDFGCGASTLLAQIFAENGFRMDSHDLHYHPDRGFLEKKYDFIVLSEVIEHLSELRLTMETLRSLLRPEGQLFIKTCFHPETSEGFASWYYKSDPTHIVFFSFRSLAALAQMLGMKGPQALDSKDLYRLWCQGPAL